MTAREARGGKVAHTPGPWAVDPTGDVGWWCIGTANAERPIAQIEQWDDDDAEERANARLIAAAPDLKTAAVIALIALDLDPENSPPQWSREDAAEYLRAAIAKAGAR